MQLKSSLSNIDNLGADSEALRFVSRDAAMIIRMRGLPFQTTEQQIVRYYYYNIFFIKIYDYVLIYKHLYNFEEVNL